MKRVTVVILLLLLNYINPVTVKPVRAFHDDGVANCKGCHSVHFTEEGTPIDPDGNAQLLLFELSTDLCLSCHATANGAVLGPDPKNPPPEKGAGNFTFLYENNINDATGGAINPIGGNHAGHNIATLSYGIFNDPDHSSAPGGSYPSNQLTCTSCHDPHGNTKFRMLRDIGQTDVFGFTFIYPAPTAEGIDLTTQESQINHTAYQSGWSDWCANCHGHYHNSGNQVFEHPTNESIDSDQTLSYNLYNGSSDPEGGNVTNAYLPELPIEDLSQASTSTSGASTSSRISCMTCHRAHATSAPKAVRWDSNVRFLDSDGFESGSYSIPNPYPDPNQVALCQKCHWQDRGNHGSGRPCMDCHRGDQSEPPNID